MSEVKETSCQEKLLNGTEKSTRLALWWLKHYESAMLFWRGFSWTWVIGILLFVIVGGLDLIRAISIIFSAGIIANAGICLSIRAMSSCLMQLEDGPEKEEAHQLMMKIIRRKVLHA